MEIALGIRNRSIRAFQAKGASSTVGVVKIQQLVKAPLLRQNLAMMCQAVPSDTT